MFYIKRKYTKFNTIKTLIFDENENLLSESSEEITNVTEEIMYYYEKTFDQSIPPMETFSQDFNKKTLFNTEEEANQKISESSIFIEEENVTYSVESE